MSEMDNLSIVADIGAARGMIQQAIQDVRETGRLVRSARGHLRNGLNAMAICDLNEILRRFYGEDVPGEIPSREEELDRLRRALAFAIRGDDVMNPVTPEVMDRVMLVLSGGHGGAG